MYFVWLAATDLFIKKDPRVYLIYKKGDHKSLYEHIKTTNYKTHKTVMVNTTIAHSWDKGLPLSKSHDIKVSVLQAFVITKDKNSKQPFIIASV